MVVGCRKCCAPITTKIEHGETERQPDIGRGGATESGLRGAVGATGCRFLFEPTREGGHGRYTERTGRNRRSLERSGSRSRMAARIAIHAGTKRRGRGPTRRPSLATGRVGLYHGCTFGFPRFSLPLDDPLDLCRSRPRLAPRGRVGIVALGSCAAARPVCQRAGIYPRRIFVVGCLVHILAQTARPRDRNDPSGNGLLTAGYPRGDSAVLDSAPGSVDSRCPGARVRGNDRLRFVASRGRASHLPTLPNGRAGRIVGRTAINVLAAAIGTLRRTLSRLRRDGEVRQPHSTVFDLSRHIDFPAKHSSLETRPGDALAAVARGCCRGRCSTLLVGHRRVPIRFEGPAFLEVTRSRTCTPTAASTASPSRLFAAKVPSLFAADSRLFPCVV
jgi:hypothetical protein